MIKAVFFDIDWTLYDHEAKRFVPSAIVGIKKLKEKGIKVFICSARNTESIFSFGLYNLGIEWDGFISSAGAFAVIGKDHVVRKTLMEHEDLVKLSSLVLKNDLTMQMVTPWSRFLIAPPNEFYKSNMIAGGGNLPRKIPFHDYQEWLSKFRSLDNKMQVVVKSIMIKR